MEEHSQEWQEVAAKPSLTELDFDHLPGQLAPLNSARSEIAKVEYIIWRDPWMAIGRQTFINSVLEKLGFSQYLSNHQDKYPQLNSEWMGQKDTFFLFSSEPYRFLRYKDDLINAGFSGAIVDGEVYSWFGIRSLRALQKYLY